MNKIIYVLLVILAGGIVSCYDDKSKDANREIPEVTITTDKTILEAVYGKDLVMTPEIKKGNLTNANLSYQWQVNLVPRGSTLVEIGDAAELVYEVANEPSGNPYLLVLKVTDNDEGIDYYHRWDLYVSNSFGEGLVVAHTGDGGTTSDLSFVKAPQITYGYDGEADYTRDVYSFANGSVIDGRVNSIVANTASNGGAYNMSRLLVGTEKEIFALVILAGVTQLLNMYLLNYILDKILEIGLVALIVVFQPELRRMLEKLGSKNVREILSVKEEQREIDRVIEQTVQACEIMAKERTGVLIVFERSIPLLEYQKSGTVVDACVSSELLRNLFFTKASLHDGAVIIRNDRIAAAGCVLPLTENHNISSDLGTRHRAGIGISEVSDAVVVIVSEETGTISVAISGMLKRHLAPQTLEKLLLNELAPQREEKTRNPLKLLRRKQKENKDAKK